MTFAQFYIRLSFFVYLLVEVFYVSWIRIFCFYELQMSSPACSFEFFTLLMVGYLLTFMLLHWLLILCNNLSVFSL